MIDNLVEITKEQLLGEIQNMRYENYRFVTATCIDTGDGYLEVIYHFDREYEMMNFKVRVRQDNELPSISRIFSCANMVENEMKELFGLNITNMLFDYEGHFLLSEGAPITPMAKQPVAIKKKGEKKYV